MTPEQLPLSAGSGVATWSPVYEVNIQVLLLESNKNPLHCSSTYCNKSIGRHVEAILIIIVRIIKIYLYVVKIHVWLCKLTDRKVEQVTTLYRKKVNISKVIRSSPVIH